MPYVIIDTIEDGYNTTKAGDERAGLRITGTKEADAFKPEEPYEKFIYDHPSNDHIQSQFRQFGPGDRVNIKMVKSGAYWDIQSVTSLDGGDSGPTPPTRPSTPSGGAPAAAKPVQQSLAAPADCVRGAAIQAAASYVAGIAARLPKATPITEIGALVIQAADRFVAYIENKSAVRPKEEAAKAEVPKPKVPPKAPAPDDDDIPF